MSSDQTTHFQEQEATRQALQFLQLLSADCIPHVDTSLLAHLKGTHQILSEWGSRPALCLAGLCHAVYGTDGFTVSLLPLTERDALKRIIGDQAEAIVYLYAACDRGFLYPQIRWNGDQSLRSWVKQGIWMIKHKNWRGIWDFPQFRNRFTGKVCKPSIQMWSDILELTFANELEILRRRSLISEQEIQHWKSLLPPCQAWVSQQALTMAITILSRRIANS